MTELQEKIIELRQQGIGQKAIAKQLGCTRDAVRRVCKKYNLDGYVAKKPLTEDEIKQKVKNTTQHFEYIGGWESCDKYIYLQCRWCGNMFKHSAQFTKKGHSAPYCLNCVDIAKAYDERKRKEQKSEEYIKYLQACMFKRGARGRQMSLGQCERCGQLFVKRSKRSRFCSTGCRDYGRLKRKDAYRYKIDLMVLYRRDKGICYLCGKPVDFTDSQIKYGTFYAGPNYPSRDHIIPQSKGGEHSWDNIRLAHFYCNTLKGTKVLP